MNIKIIKYALPLRDKFELLTNLLYQKAAKYNDKFLIKAAKSMTKKKVIEVMVHYAMAFIIRFRFLMPLTIRGIAAQLPLILFTGSIEGRPLLLQYIASTSSYII